MKVLECRWEFGAGEIAYWLICGGTLLTRVILHPLPGVKPWLDLSTNQRFDTKEAAMAAVEKHHGVRRVEG